MRRYWAVAGGTFAAFTVVFLVVETAGVRVLTEPRGVMDGAGWAAGAIGVTLLAVDALLPVPSSIVMVLHGALYGPVTGAALSLAGRVLAAAFGFAVGRSGGALVERYAGGDESERANRLFDRWGALGIVASRPVPLVAETVMVLAGASRMRWSVALAAAVAGSLPEVVVYALAGSATARFGTTSAVFLALLAVAGVVWAVLARREPA